MKTTVNDLVPLIDETSNMYIVDRQTGEIIPIETNRYRKDFIYGFKVIINIIANNSDLYMMVE